MDYHDDVEEAQEAAATSDNASEKNKQEEKLVDIESEQKDILVTLDTSADSSKNGIVHNTNENTENTKRLEEFFGNLILEKDLSSTKEHSIDKTKENDDTELSKSSEEQKLVMDIFGDCNTDFMANLPSSLLETQQQQSLNLLVSESAALFDEILNDKQQNATSDWEGMSHDTFLPSSILKQSLGDAALGMGQKTTMMSTADEKVNI